MIKEESESSPFYWLTKCEGTSEQIADLLDAEIHKPGKISDMFRKRSVAPQDPKLADALQNVHSKLQEALEILTAAVSGREH